MIPSQLDRKKDNVRKIIIEDLSIWKITVLGVLGIQTAPGWNLTLLCVTFFFNKLKEIIKDLFWRHGGHKESCNNA